MPFRDEVLEAKEHKPWSCRIIRKPELAGTIADLRERLRIAEAGSSQMQIVGATLADSANQADDPAELRARLDELLPAAESATVVFHGRALGRLDLRELKAKHPPSDEDKASGWAFDFNGYPPALIAATCHKVETLDGKHISDGVTEEEAVELWSDWESGEAHKIFLAAHNACEGETRIPFGVGSSTATAD